MKEVIEIRRIIRSRRRTIALEITPDAALTVRAPMRVPIAYIEHLVHRKRFWIRRKMTAILARPRVAPKEFVDGEEFLYLGKTVRLQVVDDAQISLAENLNCPRSMLGNAAEYLRQWYAGQARLIIGERVAEYSRQMGVQYVSIAITGAKQRLGSCSRRGTLNFSWRLMLAPMHVVDYVVVHELTHLQEHNHSRRFWQKLKIAFPEYLQAHRWVKENSPLLKL